MTDDARVAGARAWHEGVPLDALYLVAGAWGRERARGETPREWACTVYRLGSGFMDGFLSAGNDAATATDDTLLAARLREADMQRP
jgi:hypothetical protein